MKFVLAINFKMLTIKPEQMLLSAYLSMNIALLVCILILLTWPRGYKTFFMLNSAEHEIYPAYVKMPTIVGILTFIISMINTNLRI